mmetsp:Transcript_1236/g.8128  ORF Transcript_1236/g.8128 Transcript_1236/m.8128 type:complete len:242 (-) Transcript_1236:27-752(-)
MFDVRQIVPAGRNESASNHPPGLPFCISLRVVLIEKHLSNGRIGLQNLQRLPDEVLILRIEKIIFDLHQVLVFFCGPEERIQGSWQSMFIRFFADPLDFWCQSLHVFAFLLRTPIVDSEPRIDEFHAVHAVHSKAQPCTMEHERSFGGCDGCSNSGNTTFLSLGACRDARTTWVSCSIPLVVSTELPVHRFSWTSVFVGFYRIIPLVSRFQVIPPSVECDPMHRQQQQACEPRHQQPAHAI